MYNELMSNNIYNNTFDGVYLSYANNNTLTSNTINNNTINGVVIDHSNYANLGYNPNIGPSAFNIINNNKHDGVYIQDSNNTSMSYNTISNNGWDGIEIQSSQLFTIDQNGLNNNTKDGAEINNSTNYTFEGSSLNDNGADGLFVTNSTDTNSDNTITYYIHENEANGNIGNNIGNNNGANTGNGIDLLNVTNTPIIDAITTNNAQYGILLTNSTGINIGFANATSNIIGINLQTSNNNIIGSSTTNNNTDDGILLVNSNNNLVQDNTIQNNIYGVLLDDAYNNALNSNTINNNNNGVYLETSNNNTLNSNTINNSTLSHVTVDGVVIFYSNNNTLNYNTINNNAGNGVAIFYSNNNTLNSNTINNNTQDGVYITNDLSDPNKNINTLYQNTITNNKYGIVVNGTSDGNVIHFNRIVNNTLLGLLNSGSGAVNATINWWGYNSAANVASQIVNNGTGNITYNPWIILSISATPNNVFIGVTSSITADLLHDSNSVYHNPANGVVPYTGPAHFTTTKGSITDANFVNGTATSTLTNLTSLGNAIISATVDHQTVSTNVTVTGVTISQLITAANNVKSYYETHGSVLPNTVTIAGQNVNMPQFLMLLVTGTLNINNGNLNPLTFMNVYPAPSPGGSFTPGNIQKPEYLTVAQNIQTFIKTNGRAPNYAATSLGNIPFSKLVYMYSKIINFYGLNNRLPNYVSIA